MYITVVVAHLNRRKRSEAVFGSKDNQRYCGNTILAVSLRPSYHQYLRTLFAISISRKIASQLQSYASVLAKRASVVNTMAPDQESSRRIVRGVMQQTPLSIEPMPWQRLECFAPDPSTRASLSLIHI